MSKSKMTVCKACGAEIAKSARACPHCGAKVKKHRVVAIILLIIGIVLIASAIGGNDNEPKKIGEVNTNTAAQTQASTKQDKFAVGEVVELNGIKATLVSVNESNGSQFNKPTDGNVFVLCEFEIANDSNEEIAISSMLCFNAYCDDYALNYSLTAKLESDSNQLDGQIAAGKKMNGVIGYEVPADWKELEINFTPDFWAGRDITFVATH